MEIQRQVGGSFASDPVMLYAMSCSKMAEDGVKEQVDPIITKHLRRGNTNSEAMRRQGGIPRLGTIEEQEDAIDRKQRKRKVQKTIES